MDREEAYYSLAVLSLLFSLDQLYDLRLDYCRLDFDLHHLVLARPRWVPQQEHWHEGDCPRTQQPLKMIHPLHALFPQSTDGCAIRLGRLQLHRHPRRDRDYRWPGARLAHLAQLSLLI